jgi:hypothetical protein
LANFDVTSEDKEFKHISAFKISPVCDVSSKNSQTGYYPETHVEIAY